MSSGSTGVTAPTSGLVPSNSTGEPRGEPPAPDRSAAADRRHRRSAPPVRLPGRRPSRIRAPRARRFRRERRQAVSSRVAPSTARAIGPSAKLANGSATPTSATRAASCASPSPFGSTARSSPASTWSVHPYDGPSLPRRLAASPQRGSARRWLPGRRRRAHRAHRSRRGGRPSRCQCRSSWRGLAGLCRGEGSPHRLRRCRSHR